MKIIKCGIREFADQTKDKKVYCFGASISINEMFIENLKLSLAERIVGVVDNNANKWGLTHRTWFNDFPVISFEQFIERYRADPSIVLLIMIMDSASVCKQLNESEELNELSCYIYNLFQYFDHFTEIPKELSVMREGKQRIPKTIHHCWFGGGELPQKDKEFIDGWRKMMPDYEIVFWNEDNYDVYKHPFMKAAYQKKAYGFVPDYARLDIVHTHGGIYMDTDVEVLKPFDDLLYSDSFFGFVSHKFINAGHGFGGVAGASILKDLLAVYDNVVHTNIGSGISFSGPLETIPFRKRGYIGGNDFFISNSDVVYPVEFFSPKSSYLGIPVVSDNCYSIHHFNFSWASEELKSEVIENQALLTRLLSETNGK
jgi:hypothetical protein